jgi:YVTN family beta-propeller protein
MDMCVRRRFAVVALGAGLATLTTAGSAGAAQLVYSSNITAGTVSVFDAATGAPLGSDIPVGGSPLGVAVSPNGSEVYVTNLNTDSVSVIDAATRSVVDTVPVGNSPVDVAPSLDGSRLFVTNLGSGSVSVIDTATDAVVSTIAVGNSPYGIAVAPDGERAYAVNQGSHTVTVVDTDTATAVDTFAVGSFPLFAAFTPDGTRLFVASQGGGLWALDPGTGAVTGTLGPPTGVDVAVTRDGGTVYWSSTGSIQEIDLPGLGLSRTFAIGDNAFGLSVTADQTRLFATGNVGTWRVDVGSGTATQLDSPPSPGLGLAISPSQLAPGFTATAAGLRVAVDASSSVATNGVAAYRWDFGDGHVQTTTGPRVTHAYAVAGTYAIRLTLVGADGCEVETSTGRTATCQVGPPDAPPPPDTTPPAPDTTPPAPCQRAIVLTDVARHGGRVHVAGVARMRYAGQPVTLLRGSRILGHATVAQDGSFRTTLRVAGRRARVRAVVAGHRSRALRVTRLLRITGRRALSDGRLRVTGRVPGGRGAVQVRAQTGCVPSRTRTLRTVRADRRGRVAVTLPRPSAVDRVAVYRLATRRPSSFSLPVLMTR